MAEPKSLKELYERQVAFEKRVLEAFTIVDTIVEEQTREIKKLKKRLKK